MYIFESQLFNIIYLFVLLVFGRWQWRTSISVPAQMLLMFDIQFYNTLYNTIQLFPQFYCYTQMYYMRLDH